MVKKTMTHNKILLTLMFFLLALPFALAEESTITTTVDAVYKVGENVDIKIPCISNNSYCSAAFTCNITIIRPDTTTWINNAGMTRNSAYYNYTIPEANVTVVGTYKVQIVCSDGNNKGYDFGEFQITNSGMTGIGKDMIVPAVILITILLFCVFMSFTLHENDYPLKLLFIFFSLFMTLILIQFANLSANEDIIGLTKLLDICYYIMLPVIVFVSFYFLFVKFLQPLLKKINSIYKEKNEGKEDETIYNNGNR